MMDDAGVMFDVVVIWGLVRKCSCIVRASDCAPHRRCCVDWATFDDQGQGGIRAMPVYCGVSSVSIHVLLMCVCVRALYPAVWTEGSRISPTHAYSKPPRSDAQCKEAHKCDSLITCAGAAARKHAALSPHS